MDELIQFEVLNDELTYYKGGELYFWFQDNSLINCLRKNRPAQKNSLQKDIKYM